MDVSLRRLRASDISQVVDIEREAFSPLWATAPFKRELNNRYASYLVACCGLETQEMTVPEIEGTATEGSLWGRVVRGAKTLMGQEPGDTTSESYLAGYVSVWYQGKKPTSLR